MSKFTKGKWEYVEYIPEGITLNGKEYLVMSGGEDVALALRENDARLIAAAPEMYETLKICANVLFGHWEFAVAQKVDKLLAHIDGEEDNDD